MSKKRSKKELFCLVSDVVEAFGGTGCDLTALEYVMMVIGQYSMTIKEYDEAWGCFSALARDKNVIKRPALKHKRKRELNNNMVVKTYSALPGGRYPKMQQEAALRIERTKFAK